MGGTKYRICIVYTLQVQVTTDRSDIEQKQSKMFTNTVAQRPTCSMFTKYQMSIILG